MKKLNLYILKSYAGPFVLTFFVVIFILLMQFLWKYIDDLVGKGLEWYVIAELLFYTSASLVPIGLPLAVLLSSIMTFGNLGESYELVAMKTSGLSLNTIMKPLIITSICLCIGAFYFSNVLLPLANLKAGSLLWDVRQQKPALNIRPGVFYNGIDGYSIKVEKKNKKENLMEGMLIYDHSSRMGNNKVIIAKSGRMTMTDDERFLILTLYDGYSYEEMQPYPVHQNSDNPLRRLNFKENAIRFDLSSFKMTRTNEDLFKDHEQMLNVNQLVAAEDTIANWMIERKNKLKKSIDSRYYIWQHPEKIHNIEPEKMDSMKPTITYAGVVPFANSKHEELLVIQSAIGKARNAKLYVSVSKIDMEMKNISLLRHKIEWHRKFTLSFACLILFFVGAPLGAIIRKGGLGMPVVVSVIFFLMYHVLSITGEKMVKEGVIEPYEGMWVASIFFLPIGVFLTYKATNDSVLFDIDAYIKVLTPWRKRNE